MGAKQSNLRKFYDLREKIGRGSFAVVRRARRKSDNKEFAIKTIQKAKLSPESLANLRNEVAIMSKINHPNVVHFLEMFETPKELHLVMELLTGGELFDRINQRRSFSEKEASEVIRSVTSAIGYLHSIGITHRDLKPENLIYETTADDSPIKVIDFGLSNFRPLQHIQMHTPCGTPGYVAPEVLRGEPYTPAVDLWSIGVICYVLLCGYPPFYHKNVKKLYKKIMAGDYEFADPHWTDISDSAKSLVRGLMTVDVSKRMTSEEVLRHPWVTGTAAPLRPLPASHSMFLKVLQARRKLRKVVGMLVAAGKIQRFLKEMELEETSPDEFKSGVAFSPSSTDSTPSSPRFIPFPSHSVRQSSEQHGSMPTLEIHVDLETHSDRDTVYKDRDGSSDDRALTPLSASASARSSRSAASPGSPVPSTPVRTTPRMPPLPPQPRPLSSDRGPRGGGVVRVKSPLAGDSPPPLHFVAHGRAMHRSRKSRVKLKEKQEINI